MRQSKMAYFVSIYITFTIVEHQDYQDFEIETIYH